MRRSPKRAALVTTLAVYLVGPACAVQFEDWPLVEEATGGGEDGEAGLPEGGEGGGGDPLAGAGGSGGVATGGLGTDGGGGSGGSATGGVDTGGGGTGGTESGGSESGGSETGGLNSGGTESGGVETGGATIGGTTTGGVETGGVETGGVETGGVETGGTPTGGMGGTSTGGTGAVTYGIPGQSCTSLTGTECQGESCCTSILVPGGTFMMGRSEVSTDADYFSNGHPSEVPEHAVTVDSYYLDKYEVTVGRFRAFVEQYDGTPPAVGAGAHPSIAGTGWDSAWDRWLPARQADLMANLDCSMVHKTWTDTADAHEAYAINCVSWYEAQAFCAWDGGRLPTEAEWEYAAAGGTENRLYPWGSAASDATLVNSLYSDNTPFLAVGSKPLGAGRWRQQDLAGGMWEWAFDLFDEYWYSNASATDQNACNVTSNVTVNHDRVVRGGSWSDGDEVNYVRSADRPFGFPPNDRTDIVGLRCARTP